MEELTKSQKSRIAIRLFKTTAGALALRGFYNKKGARQIMVVMTNPNARPLLL